MRRYQVLMAAGGVAVCLWLIAATSAIAQPPFGRGRGPGGLGGPPGPDWILERHDKNKDGKLTKDEVPEAVWGRLSRADADNDGIVTKDELAKLQPQGLRRGGPGPAGRGRGSEGPRGNSPADESGKKESAGADRGPRGRGLDAIFNRLDKNGDGVLSKEEFAQAAAQRREYQRRAAAGRGPWGPPRGPAAQFRGGWGSYAWMQGGQGTGRGPQAGRGQGPRGFGGPPMAGGNRYGRPGGPAWMQRGRGPGRGPQAMRGQGPREFGGPPMAGGGNRDGRPGGPARVQRGPGKGRGPQAGRGPGPRGFGGPPSARDDETDSE